MNCFFIHFVIVATLSKSTVSRVSRGIIDIDESSVNERYYPRYHIASPSGWLNDPTGWVYYKNEYHMFYQYNPMSSFGPGIAHWGHATSKDLVHWEHQPIAIFPDSPYDSTGAFTGSSIVENDLLHIIYTGNVNQSDQILYYHVERQALVTSNDGRTFQKYEHNPILLAERHQPNIRDPKVWKHEGTYYMLIGSSYKNDTLGRIVLFKSKNLLDWEEASIIGESDGPMGYMWECPDLFALNGTYIFMFSPQGLEPDGDKFNNLHQTGYMLGNFDYDTYKFEPSSEFRELDHGHDIYTTATILDEKGRRLVMAWVDAWHQKYPEEMDGWAGILSLPRVMTLSLDGNILQNPIEEMETAREKLLFSGRADENDVVFLIDKTGEVIIESSDTDRDFSLFIESENLSFNDNQHASVRISYDYKNGKMVLDRRGKDAIRQHKWRPKGKLRWRIFIDASSIELFCGEGEATFTSRYFPEGVVRVRLGNGNFAETFTVYALSRTVPKPSEINI